MSPVARYLADYSFDANGDALAAGTCKQYLSNMKNFAKKLYGKSPDFKGMLHIYSRYFQLITHLADDEWWTTLNKQLIRRISAKCISNGDLIASKAIPIYRKQLLQICSLLLKQKDIANIQKLAAIVTAFHGVGRSGEWGLFTFYGNNYVTY